jgi:hypothetical protein
MLFSKATLLQHFLKQLRYVGPRVLHRFDICQECHSWNSKSMDISADIIHEKIIVFISVYMDIFISAYSWGPLGFSNGVLLSLFTPFTWSDHYTLLVKLSSFRYSACVWARTWRTGCSQSCSTLFWARGRGPAHERTSSCTRLGCSGISLSLRSGPFHFIQTYKPFNSFLVFSGLLRLPRIPVFNLIPTRLSHVLRLGLVNINSHLSEALTAHPSIARELILVATITLAYNGELYSFLVWCLTTEYLLDIGLTTSQPPYKEGNKLWIRPLLCF